MAPETKVVTPLGKAALMTLGTLFLSLITPLRPVGAEILYAETAPMSFEVWAADLAPGFFLQEQTINDRLCYCKKPGSTGSSTAPLSFSFNTPNPLTSSGVPGSSFEFVFLTPGDQMQLTSKPPQNDTATTGKECGLCNAEYTIGNTNFMDIIEWKSPGWDQGKNYPDGCTCTLKVHVRLSQWGYFVYDFAAGSNIKALNNCAFDRMEVNLNGNKDIWCDADMSKFSGGEYTYGVPQDYTFTFISDAADGNQVAAGFSLTIQAYNFGRHL
ncbi:uncharacterized protein LOC135218509 [Macrobrachium nipponense]|uniref:uncharacterized protein LOC135218509 n=1 Tax=Macrobrachium nipponense TaxID=159736 RepID=UPI0030C84350